MNESHNPKHGIHRRNPFKGFALAALVAWGLVAIGNVAVQEPSAAKQMNVVFVPEEDLGWGDVS